MEFYELLKFAEQEHKRLIKHYKLKDNSITKYTIFAKLVEEMGELSEQILTSDSLQRSDKLKNSDKKISHEIADNLICLLILGKELNVDIKKALDEKISKIKSRTY